MPIYDPDILEQGTGLRTVSYRDKDVMLYVPCVGLGHGDQERPDGAAELA